MTQREIDKKIYELNNFIADKFKDMQMQSAALKNPEDHIKANQLMTKISDDIADVRKAFDDVTQLYGEQADDDETEYTGFADFFIRQITVS